MGRKEVLVALERRPKGNPEFLGWMRTESSRLTRNLRYQTLPSLPQVLKAKEESQQARVLLIRVPS